MLPLEGIRVLDLSEVWAGPMAMTLLGDLGAEVLKVESFPRAPNTRPAVALPGLVNTLALGLEAPDPWNHSATHNLANRNKLAITLNLRHPRGLELLKQLVTISDVIVNSYSAGTIEGLGLGYDVVSALNPGIIMLSMPGWGVDGPYQGYVTLGSGIDAYVGHHLLRSYPDLDVTSTSACVHSDAVAAATAAFAVQVALFYRMQTGEGQYIDLSQAEALVNHLPYPLFDWVFNQHQTEPVGNRDRSYVPHGVYPCLGEDAWITLAVANDTEFGALCRVIGQPHLADDARFATLTARLVHHDTLDEIIAAWTRGRSSYEAMQALQEAGVAAGVVLSTKEVFDDPQYVEREAFPLLEHPRAGTHQYPGFLWRFSKTPMSIRHVPALLNQHKREVFCDLLGLDAAELEELERNEVIGTAYAPNASQ